MTKNVYYYIAKVGLAYHTQKLIYDAKFKSEEETIQAMTSISFSDLLSSFFFEKESMFSIASAIGKPLHLDMAKIKKIRPSLLG